MVLPAKIFLTCLFTFFATMIAIGIAKECDFDDYEWVVYTLTGLLITSTIGMFVSGIWRIWIG